MDKQTYELTELIRAFQKALRSVAPIAEEVGLGWKTPEAYDDWEAIEAGLYKGFLLEGISQSKEYSASKRLPLAPYEMMEGDYSSYCYVAASWGGRLYPLVSLDTLSEPFDLCVLAEYGEGGKFKKSIKVPFDQCTFVLSEGGTEISSSLSW